MSVKIFVPLFLMLFSGTPSYSTPMPNHAESEEPIKTLRYEVKISAEKRFLMAIKEFAAANRFAIRVGYPTKNRSDVLVQLWREDVKVIAINALDPEKFRVSFYRNEDDEMQKDTINLLARDIESRVMRIDGVKPQK